MGLSLVSGRTFGPEDRRSESQFAARRRSDTGVVVVTEAVARTLWPGQDPIGQALWLPDLGDIDWRAVVGVIEDIQFHSVGAEPALHVFVPYTQYPSGNLSVIVKSGGPGAPAIGVVRSVIEDVEPGTGIDQIWRLDTLVSRATSQPRFTTRAVAAFGALALVLTAVGIYGTLSHVVGVRTREIAIRMSLGASPHVILPAVMKRGLAPIIGGGLTGVAVAAGAARIVESLLFEVEPFDATSFAAGVALMLVAALAAVLAPARRMLRVDPVVALRAE